MNKYAKRYLFAVLALSVAATIGFISGRLIHPDHFPEKALPTLSPTSAASAKPTHPGETSTPGKETQTFSGSDIGAGESYTSGQPKLMALMLNDSIDRVVSRYGKPTTESTMDDADGSIKVYQYNGFSVGFNETNKVLFIETHLIGIDPGLNGFRVGESPDKVVRSLGKPDTDTGYVLSYKTASTILKMDVDPLTQTVQSVKLFGRSSS
ncbi:hypothetical protein [Gorillibacterium massiliense]|uniref:hypothetical protein n=1 Tax=Gorillibacterium massiliense TaxID=1280390 RepID=UPI0004B4F42B|nr:hypothetical protein [Gorillibacterium massiliense]